MALGFSKARHSTVASKATVSTVGLLVDLLERLAQLVAANKAAELEQVEAVLERRREQTDFGRLIERCRARGFVTKAELSGPALRALMR